jgi:hypothetical protein
VGPENTYNMLQQLAKLQACLFLQVYHMTSRFRLDGQCRCQKQGHLVAIGTQNNFEFNLSLELASVVGKCHLRAEQKLHITPSYVLGPYTLQYEGVTFLQKLGTTQHDLSED